MRGLRHGNRRIRHGSSDRSDHGKMAAVGPYTTHDRASLRRLSTRALRAHPRAARVARQRRTPCRRCAPHQGDRQHRRHRPQGQRSAHHGGHAANSTAAISRRAISRAACRPSACSTSRSRPARARTCSANWIATTGAALAEQVASATNYRVLGWWDNGIRHISNAVRPIRTPADCVGLRLRTLDNAQHQSAFRRLGFVPTFIDVADLPRAVADHRSTHRRTRSPI